MFKGRISQKDFFIGLLFITFFEIIYELFFIIIYTDSYYDNLLYIFTFFVGVVFGLSIFVRRLHDINLSGWWFLLFSFTIIFFSNQIGDIHTDSFIDSLSQQSLNSGNYMWILLAFVLLIIPSSEKEKYGKILKKVNFKTSVRRLFFLKPKLKVSEQKNEREIYYESSANKSIKEVILNKIVVFFTFVGSIIMYSLFSIFSLLYFIFAIMLSPLGYIVLIILMIVLLF